MSVASAVAPKPARRGLLLVSGNDGPAIATGATWGGLLADAERDARAAAQLLASGRLPSRGAAVEAMSAHADLLAAAGQLWRGLWADAGAPPAAVARFGRCLSAQRPRHSDGAASSAVASLWRSAAVSVRSATDLLATHRGPAGSWRSPESCALAEPDLLVAGSGRLAGVVLVVLAGSPDLVGELDSHGIGAATTKRALGELDRLRAAARGCLRLRQPSPLRLEALGLARPTVGRDLSASALADRLTRVRRTAWELAAADRVPVTSLADIAACAGDLCGYAGAPTRQAPWRRLRRGLAELRTVTPPSATLQADVCAVRWLLRAAPSDGRSRALVDTAVDGLPQLARWGAAAFARAASGDLYLVGSALRGDEVTEHPELVRAKLSGRIVLAPCDRRTAIAAAYAAAASD